MRRVKTAVPRMSPRRIDDARTAAAQALSAARHPDTGALLFPKLIATAAAYQNDPAHEGYPDLIAMPDEPYWVGTKLTSSRAWVEPDSNLPGTHRPEGIAAMSGTGLPTGRNLRAHLTDVTPTILALLGHPIPAHIAYRSTARRHPRPSHIPASPRCAATIPKSRWKDLTASRSNTRSRSKRSSSSALPTWDTWCDASCASVQVQPAPRRVRSAAGRTDSGVQKSVA
jgi:hypothetical protein